MAQYKRKKVNILINRNWIIISGGKDCGLNEKILDLEWIVKYDSEREYYQEVVDINWHTTTDTGLNKIQT